MQYEYTILPELRLVIEKISGDITLEEMIEKTQRLFADARYQAGYNGVSDLRQGLTRMSKVELYGFAHFINESEQFGQNHWAILAADPMVVALSQVFQQRLTDPNTIGVFSTVAEAAKFIKTPEVNRYLND